MPDDFSKRLTRAKIYIKNLNIRNRNRNHILNFIEYLDAEGLTLVRQTKYCYTLGTLSKLINKDFSKITKDDVVKLINKINEKDYTEWTKRDFKIVLKRLIKFIKEQDGNEYDKREYPKEVKFINTTIKHNQKKKPKEILSIDEVKKLADNTENLRDRCFILTTYETGARISEILGLKIKDIEFDKYGARAALKGKTGIRKIRIVASAPSISNWLTEHPDRKNKDGYLFCSIGHYNRKQDLDTHTFRKMLKITAKKAGIDKPVNPHNFRHSRATELAKKLTEAQLCTYMGWEIGSREARTYVHLSGRDNDKAILSLHGLVEEEKEVDKFTPIKCPRCDIKNDPGAKFCSGCSLGLDEKTIMEFDRQKEISSKIGFDVQGMAGDKDFMLRMMTLMAKEWEMEKNKKN
jgi:integrase/recombinase XerD